MTTTERPRWYYHPVTERQRAAIRVIRDMLGVEFEGTTKGHAIGFIGEHYEHAKEVRRMQREVRIERGTAEPVTNADVAKLLLEANGPWVN